MIQTPHRILMTGILDVAAAVKRFGPDVAAYEQLGHIKATMHPNGELIIFNYTPEAQYVGTWTPVERVCRGLIVHWPTQTIRALPFQKFFNLGQMPETQMTALPNGPMEITEKQDGSLGILYWDGEAWAMATRGSFTSDQAMWATNYLRQNYDLSFMPHEIMTLLFEIIYPENRIVLDYADRHDLVLLGGFFHERSFLFGQSIDRGFLESIAESYRFSLVPQIQCDSLDQLVTLAKTRQGEEGWVIRFANELRVKIKTDEYVRLHKILTRCTARTIWEVLSTDQSLATILDNVPDEFYTWVQRIVRDLQQQFVAIANAARKTYDQVKDIPTRRDQALALKESAYKDLVFKMLDNKPIAEKIWKLIRPEATKPFRVDEV